MKIISTADYGYRTVIRAVEDDSIPKWIHADKSPHVGLPSAVPDVDGYVETVALAAYEAEFGLGTAESGHWCRSCQYGWKPASIDKNGRPINHGEFIWDIGELTVQLNAWGNPIHDSPPVQTGTYKVYEGTPEEKELPIFVAPDRATGDTRLKKWDECYEEIDVRLAAPIDRGLAPASPAPAIIPEV